MFDHFKTWYRQLPDKKRYFEFLSAVLSIPVLVTVLITNVGNIRGKNNTPLPSPTIVMVTPSMEGKVTITPTPPPSTSSPKPANDCKRAVGPVEITQPTEGSVVTDSPLSIDVHYTAGEYCSVVWAYRLNNGDWSAYSDKSFELYGLPPGDINLEVRVKSVVSADTVTLQRHFRVEELLVDPNSSSQSAENR